ncbi:hypothetical protein DY123_07110 [Apilactobacillus micheneri]|uniref:hypothetical protein n=1 Tax=Apilactobacillus micheneri TaxID=1899430 RepID=UPI0011285CEB|nr:hypothetical protein [Apilactobacillus micheneri]TPR41252.1 hypothetical protein DY123_07110 [Apilactobacillus micheneri]
MGLQAMINVDEPNEKILDGSFGYAGFKWLRDDLALNVGYEYKLDDPNDPWGKIKLCWPDEAYDPVLNKFFLAPDTDFSLSPNECKTLYGKFSNADIKNNNQKRYEIFMNWLKQSIDNSSTLDVG